MFCAEQDKGKWEEYEEVKRRLSVWKHEAGQQPTWVHLKPWTLEWMRGLDFFPPGF